VGAKTRAMITPAIGPRLLPPAIARIVGTTNRPPSAMATSLTALLSAKLIRRRSSGRPAAIAYQRNVREAINGTKPFVYPKISSPPHLFPALPGRGIARHASHSNVTAASAATSWVAVRQDGARV